MTPNHKQTEKPYPPLNNLVTNKNIQLLIRVNLDTNISFLSITQAEDFIQHNQHLLITIFQLKEILKVVEKVQKYKIN